jgi:tetratricopeptide (TPR) repeat protein
VAGLFALHPLHVESVAWISERKDVLSTFFLILALGAYARFVARPGAMRYLALAAVFGLGLMSKSMVLTVPCVLLLLDYWPLRRFGEAAPARDKSTRHVESSVFWLIMEKLPLFAMALASAGITLYAQFQFGRHDPLSLLERMGFALVAYMRYLGQTLWPEELIPYHARQAVSGVETVVAVGVLVSISCFVFRFRRRWPYLPVAWLWYLGTLFPVIGFVEVQGGHGMADRYTYVPLIGLFIAAAWGFGDLVCRLRIPRAILALAVSAVLIALAGASWRQVGYWHDSVTLWRHTLQVDRDNFLANYSMGAILAGQGKVRDAIPLFSRAVAADRSNELARYAFGQALAEQGQLGEAVLQFLEALRINPNRPDGHTILGHVLEKKGDLLGAREHYVVAVQLDPTYQEARLRLAHLLNRINAVPSRTSS